MRGRGSHLELHRGIYRAVLRVPRDLVEAFGTEKLKRSLGTSSLSTAEKAKLRVLADWLKLFDETRAARSSGEGLTQNAAQRRSSPKPSLPTATILKAAHELRGAILEHPDLRTEILEGHHKDLKSKGASREQLSMAWNVSSGVETIGSLLETWKGETAAKPAHRDAIVREVRRLNQSADPKALTRKDAAGHVRTMVQAGVNTVTIGNRVRALSAFWRWLLKRGEAEANPWHQQAPDVKADDRSGKRPWRNEEAQAFLDASLKEDRHTWLAMAVRLAMFAGLRCGEMANLGPGDIGDGWIAVRAGKTASAARRIPQHASIDPEALRAFVQANPRRATITKGFGELRDMLAKTGKVEGRAEGKTQAAVDLHGGRRWFAAQLVMGLERPDCGYSQVTIDQLMGHRSGNLAVDTYAKQATSERALRAAIERIGVP